jgi:hypothetical protein
MQGSCADHEVSAEPILMHFLDVLAAVLEGLGMGAEMGLFRKPVHGLKTAAADTLLGGKPEASRHRLIHA